MNDKLKEEIRKTLGILKNGGVILYPTDTIWGLGCDATNPEAVKRIYDIKKRADNKSMLVLLDDAGKIASYPGYSPRFDRSGRQTDNYHLSGC